MPMRRGCVPFASVLHLTERRHRTTRGQYRAGSTMPGQRHGPGQLMTPGARAARLPGSGS
jgi:hypothetical protein